MRSSSVTPAMPSQSAFASPCSVGMTPLSATRNRASMTASEISVTPSQEMSPRTAGAGVPDAELTGASVVVTVVVAAVVVVVRTVVVTGSVVVVVPAVAVVA